MSKTTSRWWNVALCAALFAAVAPARAENDEAFGFERTPPRLSFSDGEVSFLRPGAADWTPALVNTALAAGDQLYTGKSANLELQVGARAFVRAGENTQLALTSLEPDFLQLRVTAGHLSLDLRSLKAGQTLELDAPNAAFNIERSGYYRIEVDGETTSFTSRRGGHATITPASGDSVAIAASEQVVVTGADTPQIESYAAPELDAWDRWNYARTDDQLDAVSARYVPSGVYGADDLDHYGDWRVVPSYGAVWVPRGLAVGWAPYSSGRWVYDPYFAWTWVDNAPWGWAPYHYGRWVHVSGYWGWCPGPIVVRPYYSPALVAFYGGGGFSVGVTFGTPYVGWVALGWGEPVVPWWGPAYYRGHPHWGGWGGPRVVNKVVINNKTVIKGDQINVYQNASVHDAIVGVDRKHFARRSRGDASFARMSPDKLSPLHGELDVRPDRSSLVAVDRSAQRPPGEAWKRSVVATREPRPDATPPLDASRNGRAKPQHGSGADAGLPEAALPAHVVSTSREGAHIATAKRPPFGTRSDVERSMPRPTPRFEKPEPEQEAAVRSESERGRAPERPRASERSAPVSVPHDVPPRVRSHYETSAPPRPEARAPSNDAAQSERAAHGAFARPGRTHEMGQGERAASPAPGLPGEPANRVYRPPHVAAPASIANEGERAARTPSSGRSHAGHGSPAAQPESAGEAGGNARGWSGRR